MTDKEKIRNIIELFIVWNGETEAIDVANLDSAVDFIVDSLQEEPVSKDLGEYINELSKQFPEASFAKLSRIAVRVAKWQKEHLWKPAASDALPEIDREVIALLNNGKIVFAHRPYKEKYIGKNLATGNTETFENKTYDKGGWNQPDVKWWLDIELPKEK